MLNLPIKLAISVALAFMLSNHLGPSVVCYFYSISVLLKDVLMFLLPFVVFSYLGSSILKLQKQALALILGVFGMVVIANITTVFTAYGVAQSMLGFLKPVRLATALVGDQITALWRLPHPSFLSSSYAMVLGLVVGVIGNITQSVKAVDIVETMRIWSIKGLNTIFIPFLPVYVFGFVLKIGFEGALGTLARAYAPVFFLSLLTIKIYLLFWYWVGCDFKLKATFKAISNMLPAWMTAFSTMSSDATMPVTLKCVEKNIHNSHLTNFFVPATANIHMLGDGINVTITALALLVMSGLPMPSLTAFLSYVGAFVIVKFSGSGVPGGGVIILVPVVEQQLGLSSDLASLMTTLYILQDSLMTASNVAGNGALALLAKKMLSSRMMVLSKNKL